MAYNKSFQLGVNVLILLELKHYRNVGLESSDVPDTFAELKLCWVECVGKSVAINFVAQGRAILQRELSSASMALGVHSGWEGEDRPHRPYGPATGQRVARQLFSGLNIQTQ